MVSGRNFARPALSSAANQDAQNRWFTLKTEMERFGKSRPIDSTLFEEVAQFALELEGFIERELSSHLHDSLLLGLHLAMSGRHVGTRGDALLSRDQLRRAAQQRIADPHSRPWQFEDPQQIAALLNGLNLAWADVFGEPDPSLAVDGPRIEVEGSRYKHPWDCWTLIENALLSLHDREPYLGVILGPDATHPVGRQGFDATINLAPTCFQLLKKYLESGIAGVSRKELEDIWRQQIGDEYTDNVQNSIHVANSKLRKVLKTVALQLKTDQRPTRFTLVELGKR